jgi:hypothetical protein
MSVKAGQFYRHYKNGITYLILTIAIHTETQEEMIVYQDTSAPEKIWTRSRAMFEEDVVVDGKTMKRFTPVEE